MNDPNLHPDSDTHSLVEPELDWPQFYVTGENIDEEMFEPVYYRIEGPNGPISFQTHGREYSLPATMFDFAMDANTETFRWCEKSETPWSTE